MASEKLINNIKELKAVLKDNKGFNLKAVVGLDGFIDEILHVVKTRNNVEDYERLKKIEEFGQRIIKAAGLSTNIEMVPVQVKLGGNGPILSNALIKYGVDLTYIGALGKPNINSVFKDMASKCEVISIADPGHTDAVEFEDGKVMIGKIETLKDVNWENLKKELDVEKLACLLDDIDLLGLENWTMIPYMNEIWDGLINEVFPLMETPKKTRIAFFDLADPEKRTNEDILEALSLIEKFSSHFKVILGLNKKEAVEIAEVMNLQIKKITETEVDLEDLVTKVANQLNLDCLVVHPVDEAAAYANGKYYHTKGAYTPNPKLTTGAGDNFNAGFCLSQSLGFSIQHSLVLGCATSGFYVRNADSPELADILGFLDEWQNDEL